MNTIDNQQNGYVLGSSLPEDRAQALKFITETYLAQLDPDDYVAPEKIASDIVVMTRREFALYNENAITGGKWRLPSGLEPEQIADIMLHVHNIKNINYAELEKEKEYDMLAIYQENGDDTGIYVSDETEITNLIWRYNNSLDSRKVKEVLNRLKKKAERVERCNDRDLIAVNNGIFNYKTKKLELFTPDLVFTAKCRVDYNPVATSPVIQNPDGTYFEVENWVKELFFDGSDIPETIWQIMGAVIRPNVKWEKSAWFMSVKGAGGKSTLCHLMRNLVGENSYAAIALPDFGKDFMLEQLVHATSIITDENDVGTYIDKSGNLKAIITNDVIQINRKHKSVIKLRFKGFMVQCVNEMPRIKDRSESFYRRQLFIPFAKCFTGMERKYIKDDYLNRKEVLEYVLYRVLNMNYYELAEPEECRSALEEFKTFNDPVRDFLEEVLPAASWECLPSKLLYEMYTGWYKINNPSGVVQGKNTFINDVKNLIDPAVHGWHWYHGRVLNRMQGEEPLLNEYSCTTWMANPNSTNKEHRIKTNKCQPFADGLFKCGSTGKDPINYPGIPVDDDDDDEPES